MIVTSNYQPPVALAPYKDSLLPFQRHADCVSQFFEEGVCVLDKNNDDDFSAIMAHFGPPLDQSGTGQRQHEFSIVPTSDSGAHVRSRIWQPLHMDALYRADSPDLVVLTCIEPAEFGGANTLLTRGDYVNVLARLSSCQRAALNEPIGYCRSGKVHFRDNTGLDQSELLFRFSPYPGRLLFNSQEQHRAWNHLARSIWDAPVRTVLLQAGERLMIDNRYALHGRTAFAGRRHVIRHWYAKI